MLNTNGAFDSGGDADPQVTTDGLGNWVAVWKSNENLGGTAGADSDIFVARSTDNGATWTPPALLNTNGASDSKSDLDPQVTTDGAGNWVAVWDSYENLGGTAGMDFDIFVVTSTDNGATWTAPALLNSNGASDSGRDYVPQVTTDGAGNWVAVWSSIDDLDGAAGADSDIFVATSTDNGATWTPPALLNTNASSDAELEYEDLPQVTTDGAGNWVAVWGCYFYFFDPEEPRGWGRDADVCVTTFAFPVVAGPGGPSGSCFIATAAYGTPLAEDINAMRVFRDRHLLTNAFGAAFTDAYYRLSPPIADRVASSAALAGLVRLVLTMLLGWRAALRPCARPRSGRHLGGVEEKTGAGTPGSDQVICALLRDPEICSSGAEVRKF